MDYERVPLDPTYSDEALFATSRPKRSPSRNSRRPPSNPSRSPRGRHPPRPTRPVTGASRPLGAGSSRSSHPAPRRTSIGPRRPQGSQYRSGKGRSHSSTLPDRPRSRHRWGRDRTSPSRGPRTHHLATRQGRGRPLKLPGPSWPRTCPRSRLKRSPLPGRSRDQLSSPAEECHAESRDAGFKHSICPPLSQEEREPGSTSAPEQEIQAAGVAGTVTTSRHVLNLDRNRCGNRIMARNCNRGRSLSGFRSCPRRRAWRDQAPFITDTVLVEPCVWTGPIPTFDLATTDLTTPDRDEPTTASSPRATTARGRESTPRQASVTARSKVRTRGRRRPRLQPRDVPR